MKKSLSILSKKTKQKILQHQSSVPFWADADLIPESNYSQQRFTRRKTTTHTHVHMQTDTTMFDYFYIFVHTLILEMCCIWDCWRHSSPNSCVSHDFHYNDNLPLCLERWMSPLPRWVCLARCDWLLVLVSGLIIVKHTDFTLNTFHYEHGNTRFRSTGICSFTLLHLSVCLEWCV